jgi:hypothetical protein
MIDGTIKPQDYITVHAKAVTKGASLSKQRAKAGRAEQHGQATTEYLVGRRLSRSLRMTSLSML